jgi:inner membrane protein
MMVAFMPSPVGHALAGIAVAWGAELFPGRRPSKAPGQGASAHSTTGHGLVLTCAALASAPDLDLLLDGWHRSATHSFVSVFVVATVAGLIAASARQPALRIASACAVAWASHMLLDWLAVDPSAPRGIQALWPFSDRRFISDWDIFPGTERENIFSAASMRVNATALVTELALMMPVAIGLWLIRVKTLASLSTELAGRHHPPE